MTMHFRLASLLLAAALATTSLSGCSRANDKTAGVTPGTPSETIDTDKDGVNDNRDNCPLVPNVNQTNTDGDSQGDACDSDDDNDGIADGPDNCDLVANANQLDANANGVGDACEGDDRDGDGIPNANDNCPFVSNANQADTKDPGGVPDGIGDACDDSDSDGVVDGADSCPGVRNLLKDANNNGIDDACDLACGNQQVNVADSRITVQQTGLLCTLSDTLLASGLNLCSVDNKAAAGDANADTFATINNTVSSVLEGITGTVGLRLALNGRVTPLASDGAVAFDLQAQTSTLELSLARDIVVTTLLDGTPVESTAPLNPADPSSAAPPLTLDLLGGLTGGAIGAPNRTLVGFKATKPFNQLQIDASAQVLSADVLEGLRVYGAIACASQASAAGAATGTLPAGTSASTGSTGVPAAPIPTDPNALTGLLSGLGGMLAP